MSTPSTLTQGSTVALLLGTTTIPALLALVTGYRRTAKVCAGVAVAGSFIELGVVHVTSPGLSTGGLLTHALLLWLPVVCLLCGFHRHAPPVTHPRRWLVALPVVTLLAAGVQVSAGLALPDSVSLYCVGVVVGVLASLRRSALVRRAGHTGPGHPLALAMLSILVLVVRLVSLTAVGAELPPVAWYSCYGQIAVLLAASVTTTLLAVRGLHQLPRPRAEYSTV